MLATVSAMAAQNIGAKKPERARKTMKYSIAIAVGFGTVASVILQFIPEYAVRIFTSDSSVITLGGQYLKGYVWDCIFAGIHFCFSGFFTACGYSIISFIHNVISITCARIPLSYLTSIEYPDTLFPMGLASPAGSPKYASAAAAIPSIVNVVLDYVFLFILDKGLEGVAVATSIGCWTGGLMVLFYILFLSKTMRLYPLKMSWKSLCLSLRNLWYQFRLGLSAFLGEISISILIFVGNYVFMKYLGEDGVAAFSIACYIMPFIFMTGNAISQSAQPIISFNHGAGNRKRVLEARKFSLLTAFALGIVVSLALAFGISYVAALFLSKDAPAYSIAAHGVPLMAIGFTLSIVNVAAIGYYQSVERALPATIFSLSRGVIFLVPCFLVIPLFAGVNGIWLALPATEALTFLSIVSFSLFRKRQTAKR